MKLEELRETVDEARAQQSAARTRRAQLMRVPLSRRDVRQVAECDAQLDELEDFRRALERAYHRGVDNAH